MPAGLFERPILSVSIGWIVLVGGCGGGSSSNGGGDAATRSTGGNTRIGGDASTGTDTIASGGLGGAIGGAAGGVTGGSASGGSATGGATSVSIPLTPTWTASTLPLDHYCDVELDTICRMFARCMNKTASNAYYEFCLAQNASRMQANCKQELSQLAASGVAYDAAKSASCVQQFDQAGCAGPDILSETSPCNAVFTGSIPLDGQCTDDIECANHRICASNGTCPGHCTEPRTEGQPCSTDANCGAGFGCGGGVCVKRTAIGHSCVSGSSVCEGLSNCMANAQGSYVCHSMGDINVQGLGETCDTSTMTLCRDGLACILASDPGGTTTSTTGTCKTVLTDGQACATVSPSPCMDYSYCAIAPGAALGTCQPWPTAGQPCGYFGGFQVMCGSGLVCIDKTCQPLLSNGANCTSSDYCLSGSCLGGICSTSHSCQTAVPGI